MIRRVTPHVRDTVEVKKFAEYGRMILRACGQEILWFIVLADQILNFEEIHRLDLSLVVVTNKSVYFEQLHSLHPLNNSRSLP